MTQKYITNIHPKLKKYQINLLFYKYFHQNKPSFIAFYSQVCISQLQYSETTTLIINTLKHIQNSLMKKSIKRLIKVKYSNINDLQWPIGQSSRSFLCQKLPENSPKMRRDCPSGIVSYMQVAIRE